MVLYTSPHLLPLIESTDKIAAATTGDNVREDINQLAQTTNTALTTEGARAEGAAKTYADTQFGGLAPRVTILEGGIIPAWKASTVYAAGYRVISPGGDVVSAKVNFTSGATYSATNWNASTQDGRIAAAETKNASQDGRLDAIEVFTPATAPDDGVFSRVSIDEEGRVTEGTLVDGTKYVPHLKIDTVESDVILFSAREADAGTTYAMLDIDGRKAENEIGDDGCVPAWVLQRWANRWPGTNGRVQKIIVVAGQSNSLWKFNTDGPALAEPDTRIKWWNRISATQTDVSPNVTPSIASAFARKYVEANPNIDVLIVPVTVGSTGFRSSSIDPPPEGYLLSSGGTWDRTLTADPNNLAQRLFDSLAGARAATGNAEVVAMLWSQGENDRSRMTETTYASAFDDLIGTIRTQVSQPNMPVIIGSMTPEEIAAPQFTGTDGIIRALENAQARLVNTAYVWGPANMLLYQEQIHWNPEGNRVRGQIMADDGLRRARLNLAGGSPYPPRRVTITRTGGTAVIGWDYPLGRAVSFTLSTSTDNGVTWTAQTLTGPLVTTHTATVATTLPLWARLTTTNEAGTSYPTMEAKS